MDYDYTNIKKSIGIEKIVNRLMNNLADEQIYDLAVEIRIGIEKITSESILEWGGAFQIISDIAEAYLTDTLDWNNFYLSDIHADLTDIQVEEIIRQAIECLGYV